MKISTSIFAFQALYGVTTAQRAPIRGHPASLPPNRMRMRRTDVQMNAFNLAERPFPSTSLFGGESEVDSTPDIAQIINGTEAVEGRYNYMVALQESYFGYYGQFCGGSLIAPDVVLTAAHCVDSVSYGYPIGASIGLHSLSESNETEFIVVKDIIIHPNWDSNFLRNDVAVLTLESATSLPVDFITLNPNENVPADGELSTVMGWGVTNPWYFNGTDVLMEVDVTPISRKECSSILGSYQAGPDTVCTLDMDVGSCYGDSGGPLIIPGLDATQDVQIGIVSWGYGCAGGYPGVYSRVSFSYEWIKEQVCAKSLNVPKSFACKRGKAGK